MPKLYPKMALNRDSKGFTLVELLVVISIISILSVIGLVLYTGLQKNARDSKRKADIDAIVKALETNYNNSSTTPYPAVAPTMFTSSIPTDPQTGAGYTGVPVNAVNSFMICASLEGATGNATSDTGSNLGTLSTGTHYCRKNAQ